MMRRCRLTMTAVAIFVTTATLFSSSAAAQQIPRVLVAGDSWGALMAAPLQAAFDNLGHADRIVVGTNTVGAGTTSVDINDPAWVQAVIAELMANPSIDVVHMFIGINDLGGWDATLTPAAEDVLLDQIEANVAAAVNGILAFKPNLSIVLSGYDYINMVDFVPSSSYCSYLQNVVLSNPTVVEVNSILEQVDSRKATLALTDSRLHYIGNFGLMQQTFGFPNLNIPPGDSSLPDVNLPSPAASMADCFHLAPAGYDAMATRAVGQFYNGYFARHPYPGSSEDFELFSTTTINSIGTYGVKTAAPGDSVVVSLQSAGGTFIGSNPFLVADIIIPGVTVPVWPANFPELHVGVNSAAILWTTPTLPNTNEMFVFAPTIPVGLSGIQIVFQGLAVTPSAANGMFATTEGHILTLL